MKDNFYMGIDTMLIKEEPNLLANCRSVARIRSTIGISEEAQNLKGLVKYINGAISGYARIKPNKINWTGLLGYLLKNQGLDGLKVEGELGNSGTTKVSNIYEAMLVQACYISRLAYSQADIFCRMVKFLDVTPDVFNDYLRNIENIYGNDKYKLNYICRYNSLALMTDPNYKQLFNSPQVTRDQINALENDRRGFFFQNDKLLNMYGYIYDNGSSKINPEKTLYLAFKGASNISEFLKSIKSVTQLKNGLTTGETDLSVGNVDNFKIEHLVKKYFIRDQKSDLKSLHDKILELIKDKGVKKIIITGHSLGGSLASFFAYWLKKYSRTTQEINELPMHVITFGEVKSLNDFGKFLFNKLLRETGADPKEGESARGVMTYDRINNITKIFGKETAKNVLTAFPPGSSHPGEDLPSESYIFSKRGLTNEIKEFRQMCGWAKPDGEPSTKNDYPVNDAFIALFDKNSGYKPLYNSNGSGRGMKNKAIRLKVLSIGTTRASRQKYLSEVMPDLTPEGKTVFGAEKDVEPQPIASGGADIQEGGADGDYRNMPNMVVYNCYTAFPTAMYMGVSFVYVLRNPMGDRKPNDNYWFYEVNGRLVSASENKKDTCDGAIASVSNANQSKNISSITSANNKNKRKGSIITKTQNTERTLRTAGVSNRNQRSIAKKTGNALKKGLSGFGSLLGITQPQTGDQPKSESKSKGWCSIL